MTLVCCGYICSYDRTWFLVLVFHSVGWWQLRHICDMVQTIGENSFMPIKAISLLRAFCLHWISPGIRPFKAKTIWVTKSSIYWSLPFHLIWQERLIWLTPGSCRGLLDISSGWYTILYPNLPFSCFPWDQDNTLLPVFPMMYHLTVCYSEKHFIDVVKRVQARSSPRKLLPWMASFFWLSTSSF